MALTIEQKKKVEENMGLVGKVIHERVHDINSMRFYTYDDLFQIGCIGLCKAAITDKGGYKFSTYAYRLIWHELCDNLIYTTKRAAKEPLESDIIPMQVSKEPEDIDLKLSLYELLDKAKKEASPSVAKGIDALVMMSNGKTAKEIGTLFNAPANHVTAWVSKARKFLCSYAATHNLAFN